MHVDRYRAALADAMGFDVARFDEPGISVVSGEDRRGERQVSHYRVGEHSVVWTDPEVLGELEPWNSHGAALSFGQFRVWALEHGAERIGAGYEHVLGTFAAPERPEQVRLLDGHDDAVVRMAAELFDACSDADREAADFDPGALDEHLAGRIDDERLTALAGGRPFASRPGFHDIGALVLPEARRQGHGRHVVAAVVESVLAVGHLPLYRCPIDHEGSWRLCRGLGFVPVAELEAFRWRG
jgi:GNAT superfamily N-acetyltransferase